MVVNKSMHPGHSHRLTFYGSGMGYLEAKGRQWPPIGLLLALLLVSPWHIESQAQATVQPPPKPNQVAAEAVSPAPSAGPTPEQTIPLAQVAERAEESDRLLARISERLTPTPELDESYRATKSQADEMSERIPQLQKFLAVIPNGLELRDEEQYWRSMNQQYTAQRRLLTARAADLEDQIRVLDEQLTLWQATLDQIHDRAGIESVLDRIRQQLEAIEDTRSRAKEQLKRVLTLQNLVSQQDRQISDVLIQLGDAQKRLRGRLFHRDSPPLWAIGTLHTFEQPMATLIPGAVDRDFASAEDFLAANKFYVSVIVALYFLSLVSAFKLKRYAGAKRAGVGLEGEEIFARPFSVALLVALLGAAGLALSSPTSVAFVLFLLCLVTALRLLPPLIEPGIRPLLYTLAILVLVEGVRLLVPFSSVLKRLLFSLSVLAAVVVFAWLTRPSRLRQSHPARKRLLILTSGIRTGLGLLAIALVASVVGFFALAQIIGAATLLGAFLAATYYTAVRVLALILTTVLHSDWSRTMFEKRVESIESWGGRLLILAAILLWLRSELYFLTIHDAVLGFLSRGLEYPIGYGKVYFTLSGALSVVLIMLVGYALANVVTFALQKVLLPKLRLQRGLPHAISTITYYVLLSLVVLAAVADAGVELNKFTVITGAIGVGLGFGLQNIVNNFVSGLILLFERPIHLGDTVDVGGLVGTVRRIGARSSTVVTFQGAEVIVPNSNLISNQVINWTLSSQWRRVEIPVGVAYGTDPERVLKLLLEAAELHPEVMREPRKPEAFFLGFGDSALNFELRFWSARQDTWFQIKSEVTVAVARTLQQAGIEIPFPQQDLHLKSIDASVTNHWVVTRRDLATDKTKRTRTPDGESG